MKNVLMTAAVCVIAVGAFAVENSWQKTWCEEIDLTDITSVPIGMKLVEASGFSLPTVPPWSCSPIIAAALHSLRCIL